MVLASLSIADLQLAYHRSADRYDPHEEGEDEESLEVSPASFRIFGSLPEDVSDVDSIRPSNPFPVVLETFTCRLRPSLFPQLVNKVTSSCNDVVAPVRFSAHRASESEAEGMRVRVRAKMGGE